MPFAFTLAEGAKQVRTALRRIVNRVLRPVGLKIIPAHHDKLVYQHDYGTGGYTAYREEQIRANRRKLRWVWADSKTLNAVADDISRRGLKIGICHGARNGFEVAFFRKRLGTEVIGTDISDTASKFLNMVVQDFHEPRDEWIGKFEFVYTNSLDQAFDPQRALDTWIGQLTPNGCIYIEHTMGHSVAGASKMDPFGAHPMAVPYFLFEWGRGKYRLADILHVENVAQMDKGHVWVFVVSRESNGPLCF